MTTLREACLKDAVQRNRDLMADADRMVEEGVDREELAHLFIQVATIQDRLIQALEPASDFPLHLAQDAILAEAVGDGC